MPVSERIPPKTAPADGAAGTTGPAPVDGLEEKAPVHRWSGEYFGFIHAGYLYDARGACLGHVDAQRRLWGVSGEFLGELIDGAYVLRRKGVSMSTGEPLRQRPISPVPRVPAQNRTGRLPRLGWEDGLGRIGRT